MLLSILSPFYVYHRKTYFPASYRTTDLTSRLFCRAFPCFGAVLEALRDVWGYFPNLNPLPSRGGGVAGGSFLQNKPSYEGNKSNAFMCVFKGICPFPKSHCLLGKMVIIISDCEC